MTTVTAAEVEMLCPKLTSIRTSKSIFLVRRNGFQRKIRSHILFKHHNPTPREWLGNLNRFPSIVHRCRSQDLRPNRRQLWHSMPTSGRCQWRVRSYLLVTIRKRMLTCLPTIGPSVVLLRVEMCDMFRIADFNLSKYCDPFIQIFAINQLRTEHHLVPIPRGYLKGHRYLHISIKTCLPNRIPTTLVVPSPDHLHLAEACTTHLMKWHEAISILRAFRRSPWTIPVSKTGNLSKACLRNRHPHLRRSLLICRPESSPLEYLPHWDRPRNVPRKLSRRLLLRRCLALKSQASIDRTKTATDILRIQDRQHLGITIPFQSNTSQSVLNLLEFTTPISVPRYRR